MIELEISKSQDIDIQIIENIKAVLVSSIEAVNPVKVINNTLRLRNNCLYINDYDFDLTTFRRCYIIGIGKASQSMAIGVLQHIANFIHSGLVITKNEDINKTEELSPIIKTIQGSHPIPDNKSLKAANEIIRFSKNITDKDLVICLISGGGSALVTKPVNGISLEEIQILTSQLLNCGATISEINTIRKHLDLIKGGGLLSFLYPARVVTLILSDVIGDDLSMIASGPTVPDKTTFSDALDILQKYSLLGSMNKGIISYLNAGGNRLVAETLKEKDPRFMKVNNFIVGNNRTAASTAKIMAEKVGFTCQLISDPLVGDTLEVGKRISALIKESLIKKSQLIRPFCIIEGGESTVKIKGRGRGGRNQEVALISALEIDGYENVCVATLATDGEDGPTDAAGAIVTGNTINSARQLGLNPMEYLANNDSYHFFKKVGGLIQTGSTGTNVNDLNFIFIT